MKYINIFLLILILVMQYRIWEENGLADEVNKLKQIKSSQLVENQELLDRNLSLAAEVLDLKQGMDAVEERARSDMGMIKMNETFIQIIESGSNGNNGQN